MKVFRLLGEEQINKKADLGVRITHEDLTEATVNTAQTLTLFSILANNQACALVQAELKIPFENTADAAFNNVAVTVGKSGDTAGLLASMQLNRNGTEVYLKTGVAAFYEPTADTPIIATVGSMAAKSLSDLNAGELVLYFRILDRRNEN